MITNTDLAALNSTLGTPPATVGAWLQAPLCSRCLFLGAGYPTAQEAERRARAAGWRFGPGGACCPGCVPAEGPGPDCMQDFDVRR